MNLVKLLGKYRQIEILFKLIYEKIFIFLKKKIYLNENFSSNVPIK